MQQERLLETKPHLELPSELALWRGTVSGDSVTVADTRERQVGLDGQEFFRFRGVADAATADVFAADYGLLGLPFAIEHVTARTPPSWIEALTQDPAAYSRGAWLPGGEPLEDWVRQAGLVNLACGLLGILKAERREGAGLRRKLIAQVQKMPHRSPTTVDQLIDDQLSLAAECEWPVAAILEGAARADLILGELEEWGPDNDPVRYFKLWAARRKQSGPSTFSFPIAPASAGRRGVATALVQLLDSWTQLERAVLIARDGEVAPGVTVPTTLLEVIWLQVANAVLTEVAPRRCAWERCPGPPQRPGVFLWRWSDRPRKGAKHRDSIYCHPLCKNAAQQARRRKQ